VPVLRRDCRAQDVQFRHTRQGRLGDVVGWGQELFELPQVVLRHLLVADAAQKDPVRAAAELEAEHDALRDCRRCGLCEGRTQVVYGVGDPTADLLFVGEGPGFHEDRQGEPFVGQAGKLLTELLAGIGLGREQVYIANVVKCRPPDNRDPSPEEIASCSPHLHRQIQIIQPRVICTLGRFATRLLADTDASMTSVRGRAKETEIAGRPVIVFPVFHPAAALYTPSNRTVLDEDFRKLRRLLALGRAAFAGVRDDERGGSIGVTADAGPEVEVAGAGAEEPGRSEEAPSVLGQGQGALPGLERAAPERVGPDSADQMKLW
jgi:uracil-DNA glycosylase family 4